MITLAGEMIDERLQFDLYFLFFGSIQCIHCLSKVILTVGYGSSQSRAADGLGSFSVAFCCASYPYGSSLDRLAQSEFGRARGGHARQKLCTRVFHSITFQPRLDILS